MIEINSCTLLVREIVQITIVSVMRQVSDAILADSVQNSIRNGGFPGACTAGDSNDDGGGFVCHMCDYTLCLFKPTFDKIGALMNIKVTLYYHLKEKAGTGSLDIALPDRSTIRDLKIILESQHPALKTHMDNVMMVMDKKIVLDEDFLKDNAEVAFLTPVGGG